MNAGKIGFDKNATYVPVNIAEQLPIDGFEGKSTENAFKTTPVNYDIKG
ncbi:hypothetical protein N9Y48_02445 [Zobellia sp.]|nr:hypothetical protein [Zobellia sp.]